MLDKIAVFTKGGIVLWSESFTTLVGNPIDDLIQTVLLEVCSPILLEESINCD
jgi:hypothetical protein